jgi:hypothetical protein
MRQVLKFSSMLLDNQQFAQPMSDPATMTTGPLYSR